MTIVSFLNKIDEIIENMDYYEKIALTNRNKFNILINVDNKEIINIPNKIYEYKLAIKYIKKYGLYGSLEKLNKLFFLIKSDNANNSLLNASLLRIIMIIENIYISKIYFLLPNIIGINNEGNLDLLNDIGKNELEVEYLLGLENFEQLSLFVTNENEKFEESLKRMDRIRVNAKINLETYLIESNYINEFNNKVKLLEGNSALNINHELIILLLKSCDNIIKDLRIYQKNKTERVRIKDKNQGIIEGY